MMVWAGTVPSTPATYSPSALISSWISGGITRSLDTHAASLGRSSNKASLRAILSLSSVGEGGFGISSSNSLLHFAHGATLRKCTGIGSGQAGDDLILSIGEEIVFFILEGDLPNIDRDSR